MHIVEDEQRSDRRPTSMRPLGSGLEGASASLALLDDVHRHRLRRAALHLPLPSQERGPFQFSDRLLDHGLNFWLKLRPQEPRARQTELANPKLVFGEHARIIINSGLIRKIHGRIQLTSCNPTVFAMQN
jgi:hypothetical protein